MKAELIIDSPGRGAAPGESVIVPAGTILDAPLAWAHCLPDGSNMHRMADGSVRRIGSGIVRAVPADEECREMVERQLSHQARSRGVSVERLRASLAATVAKLRPRPAK